MRSVDVHRADLLEKLKANRKKHVADLEQLRHDRFEKVVDFHQHELWKWDNDAEDDMEFYYSFPEPEDHTEDYDQVIAMLEMSVDDVVTLQHDEFQKYVMDKWHWTSQLNITKAFYSSDV